MNSVPPKNTRAGELWKNFKLGERAAFEALYNLYINDLFNYGSKLTADVTLLKDSIQDVFIELWKYKHNLCDVSDPKFYLFKSLRHRIVKNVKAVPIFIANTNIDSLFTASAFDTPDHMMLQLEQDNVTGTVIKELLDKLTARQREAIHLHFYHGFSYEEMTSMMNMNYQSILNLVQRALKTLRQETAQLPLSSFLMLVLLISNMV
ncbi:RNA polymerase sigma factor [Chitinophagaceae bacterium LWZ2-11]